MTVSARLNCLVMGAAPGDCPWLNFSFCLASTLTLCAVGSELMTLTVWLTCTPTTCGTYWQPFWSSVAGGACGSGLEEAQTGSASMLMPFFAGAAPAKLIDPAMVPSCPEGL